MIEAFGARDAGAPGDRRRAAALGDWQGARPGAPAGPGARDAVVVR